jgi:hypothetical protein
MTIGDGSWRAGGGWLTKGAGQCDRQAVAVESTVVNADDKQVIAEELRVMVRSALSSSGWSGGVWMV